MSVSNPLVTLIHNGTTCVNMVIILQNGCMCVLKLLVDVKQHLDKNLTNLKTGCNMDVLRQTVCLVVNTTKVKSFAYLFNCTTVYRASD